MNRIISQILYYHSFFIGQFNGNVFLHTLHRIKQSWIYLTDNLFSTVNRYCPNTNKAISTYTLFICSAVLLSTPLAVHNSLIDNSNGLISIAMFDTNKRTLWRPILGTFKRFINFIISNYCTAFDNLEIRVSRPSPDTAEMTRISWSNFPHSSANSLLMSDFVLQIIIGFTSKSGLN